MDFIETFALDAATLNSEQTKMRETADGYVVCMPRVARTGIQVYKGFEVDRPDLAEVRIYRPEAEVFSRDAIKTLAGKPVTVEHPDEPLTSQNWHKYSVGHVGNDVMRDGEFIRVPLHLMDARAIEEVRGGKTQLSVGYTSLVKWGDGKTDSGETYHATQTSIRANHVAITHAARGGDKLRMGDTRKDKAMKKFMVDGIQVEVEDKDAQIIERHIATLTQAVTDAKSSAQTEVATAKTEAANLTAVVATKDAEIATLKVQLTDAKVTPKKLNELARARAGLEQRAKQLLDSVVLEDKSDEEVRRQVVNAKLGDTAKSWTDDMITASFNTLAVSSNDSGSGIQTVIDVIRDNNNGNYGGGNPTQKAYDDYDKALSERWKTAGVRNSA